MDMKRVAGWLVVALCTAGSVQAQTARAYYREGYEHQKAGRLEDAIESYKKAIALNKDYGDAHYQLARVYYFQSKTKNGLAAEGERTEVETGHPTHQYVPKWDKGIEELDSAIKEFEEVARIEPKAPDALFMLGLLNHNRGRYDVAIAWHKKAIAASPRSPDAQDARHDSALIYYVIKKDQTVAVALLKENLEINPSHTASARLLGQIEKEDDMSWWKKLFSGSTRGERTESETASKVISTGPICQGVAPERLASIREALEKQIEGLPIVRQGLMEKFWQRGPIDTLSGAKATADAVIAKVQQEARLIKQHVANIESLDVTIMVSQRFDGVTHDGPEDHIVVQMARRFRSGGVDLIFHHVVRMGEEAFEFAYMRL